MSDDIDKQGTRKPRERSSGIPSGIQIQVVSGLVRPLSEAVARSASMGRSWTA